MKLHFKPVGYNERCLVINGKNYINSSKFDFQDTKRRHKKIFKYWIPLLQNIVDVFSTYFIRRNCWQRHSEELKIRCTGKIRCRGWKCFPLDDVWAKDFSQHSSALYLGEKDFFTLPKSLIGEGFFSISSKVQILQMSFTPLYVPTQQYLLTVLLSFVY